MERNTSTSAGPIVKSAPPSFELTEENCREYLYEKVFQFQPKDYCEEYPIWPGLIGIEIEMLPVHLRADGGDPDPVSLNGQKTHDHHEKQKPLAHILTELAREEGWNLKFDPDTSLLLLIELPDGSNLSFEPGGQLEFSSRPFECLSDAAERTQEVQKLLDDRLARHDLKLIQTGMNPWYSSQQVSLEMPKPRYRAMHSYFSSIGPFGPRMMRLTCTVQTNLDFGNSEEMMAERYLAGLLMSPFMNALFANSPFSEKIYSGKVGHRGEVWVHIDPSRTGVLSLDKIFQERSQKACVESYLRFALDARVVFIKALDYEPIIEESLTFRRWISEGYKGTRPSHEDFATHLSLLFPEVRPRGFLELRSVDCQARRWQLVPSMLYVGALYDRLACTQMIELLWPYREQLGNFFRRAHYGLKDETLRSIAQRVYDIAQAGFGRVPSCYRNLCSVHQLNDFRALFTDRGLTPGDLLVEKWRKFGNLVDVFKDEVTS